MGNELIFSKAARQQIKDIGLYTQEKWGIAQRNRYLKALFSACEALCREPQTGRPCSDIYEGMYKLAVGKHIIYYYHRHHAIEIAGILHDRMLPALHLGNA